MPATAQSVWLHVPAALVATLPGPRPPPPLPAGGWFSGLFGGGGKRREESTAAAAAPAVQGLYMYGGVGVGKTMLMDLLVKEAPPYFQVGRGLVESIGLARCRGAGEGGVEVETPPYVPGWWRGVTPAPSLDFRLKHPALSSPAAGAHALPRLHDRGAPAAQVRRLRPLCCALPPVGWAACRVSGVSQRRRLVYCSTFARSA